MYPVDDASTFELAPVSLWLEDLSDLKALFAQWSRAGMVSIRDHLLDNPDCLMASARAIRVIKVNRKTLSLYEADDLAHLIDNLHHVFNPETIAIAIEQMFGLWEGRLDFFSKAVNRTLGGRHLDIQLRGNILPGYEQSWSRVLVAVEDVTDLQAARHETARSEAYAHGLFEHSPVSLWVNDFSGVRLLFDEIRLLGVADLRAHIAIHPEFVGRCKDAIRMVDVNRQTLHLFGVTDKAACWRGHVDLLRANLSLDLREKLIGLWNGELFQERETVNIKLDGDQVHVHLQFSVLPGHEDDWSLTQVARVDVTARKNAEAHLQYMRNHDSLTSLHSRSFYNELLQRLNAAGSEIVTVIVADLDGLKEANDQFGHCEGDEMLRCAGDILAECVTAPWLTARTGGDEFVILMPGADEHDGIRLMVRVQSAISAANQARKGLPLSLSLGAATRRPEEPLEITVHRADAHMYEAKRQYYAINQCDRRSRAAWVSVAATKPCWPPSLAMPLTETGYNQQRKC